MLILSLENAGAHVLHAGSPQLTMNRPYLYIRRFCPIFSAHFLLSQLSL